MNNIIKIRLMNRFFSRCAYKSKRSYLNLNITYLLIIENKYKVVQKLGSAISLDSKLNEHEQAQYI